MKKLLPILLLLTFNMFGQDIKDTSGFNVYVSGNYYSGPHNKANAVEKILQAKKEFPQLNDTLIEALSFGKIGFKFPKNFFETKVLDLEKTVENQVLEVTPLSTTFAGKLYVWDPNLKVLEINLDSTLIVLTEKVHLSLLKYKSGKYIDSIKLAEKQPFRLLADTIASQDSTQTTTKTFFNKHWLFSSREGKRIDSLTAWTPFGFSPGTTEINGLPARRHTHIFKNKIYQIRALDTTFNIIKELPVKINPLFK